MSPSERRLVRLHDQKTRATSLPVWTSISGPASLILFSVIISINRSYKEKCKNSSKDKVAVTQNSGSNR